MCSAVYQPLMFSLFRCQCGNCASMATFRECVCCKEIAPMAAMIESMSVPCIIQHPGFRTVCLDIYVLQTAYYHYRQQYHHQIQDTNKQVSIIVVIQLSKMLSSLFVSRNRNAWIKKDGPLKMSRYSFQQDCDLLLQTGL